MATVTVRLPDEKHERLVLMAQRKGMSLNQLFEELATTALADFDAEARFRARAGRGSAERGLAILGNLPGEAGDGPRSTRADEVQDGPLAETIRAGLLRPAVSRSAEPPQRLPVVDWAELSDELTLDRDER